MKNMSVSKKLIASFLIVIILAVIIGGVGIIGMMQINDGSTNMYEHQTAPLGDLGEAREFFQRLRVQLREAQMSTSLAELAAVEREIADREANFEHYMALYDPTILTVVGRQLLESMTQRYTAYQAYVRSIISDKRVQIEQQDILDSIMPPAGALANTIADGITELMELRIDRTLNATDDDDMDMLVNSLVYAAGAVEFMQRMRVQLREAQLSVTLDELAAVEAEIADREAIFREYMRLYDETIETTAAQTLFNNTMASFDEYSNTVANVVTAQHQIITSRNSIDATMLHAGPAANYVADTLTELMDIRIGQAADTNVSNAAMFTTMFIIIIAVIVVAVVVALTLAVYISGLISKPLTLLASFMKKAGSTGDLALSPQDVESIKKFSTIKDEIGQTVSGAASFVAHVTNISKELEIIAGGDLTSTMNTLSKDDTMGNSLKNLLSNLNSMFGEIQSSTAQVATGSKQIAGGSQSLAQGSTEQAASVQQLSSSIAEIAQKTKGNADMAGRASTLAGDIKTSAEKGSRQMDEMMTAVRDINASSQNISKVIKSIDDIAFQTNILALNAAVEAARAGQHGKGFAVVAEEVRNLAAKSADAAKDTESLIADSIQKAELGSRIADDTASSLVEIVDGISESSQLIGDIAKSSEEQSESIEQINHGIDQVAQVVQQNSATAEQSAAASEEMSGQSMMLEELISRFKLKDSGESSKRIVPPAQSLPAHEQSASGATFGKY